MTEKRWPHETGDNDRWPYKASAEYLNRDGELTAIASIIQGYSTPAIYLNPLTENGSFEIFGMEIFVVLRDSDVPIINAIAKHIDEAFDSGDYYLRNFGETGKPAVLSLVREMPEGDLRHIIVSSDCAGRFQAKLDDATETDRKNRIA